MSNVYVSHNTIISSLGFSSKAVVSNIKNEVSGLKKLHDKELFQEPFYTSVINKEILETSFSKLNAKHDYTILEKMMIVSLQDTINAANLNLDEKVGIIISTTKGNIDVLDNANPFPEERAYLSSLGKAITSHFNFKNDAVVLSNACVSGVLAITAAKKYITLGLYDHVFVIGGDLVSKFVLSGFNSFQAMSLSPCRPYDTNRNGINLGEVVASALVTKSKNHLCKEAVEILGDSTKNDANHISGPSRTGEGLFRSVQAALNDAEISKTDIDYISAHGTATPFNDEMEVIAFNRLELQQTPLHSLKGYFGHSLGASALVETIVGMHSLHQNTLFTSLGFNVQGTSKPLNIITKTKEKNLRIFLKTASGFGGCNTAAVFKKVN